MGIRNSVIAAVYFLASTAAVAAERPSSLGSYSMEPLAKPVWDSAQYSVHFIALNNWLKENHESIPDDQVQMYRERVYSILDSHVKLQFALDRTTDPASGDVFLSNGYFWAAMLGVPGAHAILAELDPSRARQVRDRAVVPRSLRVKTRDGMLVMSSRWGRWSATFPYWFMVNLVGKYRATDGVMTQVVSISTGFGHHSHDDSHSQATITIHYARKGSRAELRDLWLPLYAGVDADELKELERAPFQYSAFSEAENMHLEAILPDLDQGAMLVTYMGLSGTYEKNRQHYVDFLAAMDPPLTAPALPAGRGSD